MVYTIVQALTGNNIICILSYHYYKTNKIQYFQTIKFVNDLRQVGGFLGDLQFPPPIKLTAMI